MYICICTVKLIMIKFVNELYIFVFYKIRSLDHDGIGGVYHYYLNLCTETTAKNVAGCTDVTVSTTGICAW